MKNTLEVIFSNVNQWLQFAEAKNAVLATLNGGAAIGILSLLNADRAALQTYFISLYALVFTLVLGLLVALGSFSPVLTRPKKTPKTAREPNLLYFHHIASLTTEEFLTAIYRDYALQDIDPSAVPNYEKHLAEQIVANARIASRKYKAFTCALWVDILGVIGSIVIAIQSIP